MLTLYFAVNYHQFYSAKNSSCFENFIIFCQILFILFYFGGVKLIIIDSKYSVNMWETRVLGLQKGEWISEQGSCRDDIDQD